MRRSAALRSLLFAIVSMAVFTQPLAYGACACDSHGDHLSVDGADSAGHGHGIDGADSRSHGHRVDGTDSGSHGQQHLGAMTPHDAPMVGMPEISVVSGVSEMFEFSETIEMSEVSDGLDPADCEPSHAACQCTVCGASVAMVGVNADSVTAAVTLSQSRPRHYLEPPQAPAFRPPIRV